MYCTLNKLNCILCIHMDSFSEINRIYICMVTVAHFLECMKCSYDECSRCMDCGVPFCQSENGCPLGNLIPKWNDLVFHVSISYCFRRSMDMTVVTTCIFILFVACKTQTRFYCKLITRVTPSSPLNTLEMSGMFCQG